MALIPPQGPPRRMPRTPCSPLLPTRLVRRGTSFERQRGVGWFPGRAPSRIPRALAICNRRRLGRHGRNSRRESAADGKPVCCCFGSIFNSKRYTILSQCQRRRTAPLEREGHHEGKTRLQLRHVTASNVTDGGAPSTRRITSSTSGFVRSTCILRRHLAVSAGPSPPRGEGAGSCPNVLTGHFSPATFLSSRPSTTRPLHSVSRFASPQSRVHHLRGVYRRPDIETAEDKDAVEVRAFVDISSPARSFLGRLETHRSGLNQSVSRCQARIRGRAMPWYSGWPAGKRPSMVKVTKSNLIHTVHLSATFCWREPVTVWPPSMDGAVCIHDAVRVTTACAALVYALRCRLLH